ncbi:ATP-binding protein [Runella slithyformis]|uniref:Transcriptional regulator n=1 Tax=Runella slithyformis (strain ATCC 29530 / DSM 19594 / LMG 11500 / NCIMB 11436 / LSU 4) TaxID=761193 RepID=A0A7U3ZNU0_RUNSL|nr:ATP-binding protein [Runella slithyformis]AEI50625.1 putative transcriptional regulator [Runella slithyformis DSM 19594]
MKIKEIIQQPEGRRLEFKEVLPTVSDLAKTIVAFANDAGGEIFIGIRNEPRELIGIPEEELMNVEERISNLIHDHCYPVIVPDISFHGDEGIHFIRIQVFRGSNFPYYLKIKGKLEGTYIRVGSSNRQADAEIIAELERQKRNISFDSELIHDLTPSDFSIEPFKAFFREKTNETLDEIALKKLGLLKEYHGKWLPTNAFVLFSDYASRKEFFPYAKIECARFKGTTSEEFIDQKTLDEGIAIQAEAAYEFILRHINKGATVKGVYTQGRWEYPVVAIREAIRNAVVHRDYSLTGKDIKVAIYDDMVEITSPGKLMPSIDFSDLEARQSDIRNKVIAPIFKKMGIIDQWGNGLKLIADEMKAYPDIEFRWSEKGLQFQVQFSKRDFILLPQQELQQELQQKLQQELQQNTLYSLVLKTIGEKTLTTKAISEALGQKEISGQLSKVIKVLLNDKLLVRTMPDKPNHPDQSLKLTQTGALFLKLMGSR